MQAKRMQRCNVGDIPLKCLYNTKRKRTVYSYFACIIYFRQTIRPYTRVKRKAAPAL